MKQRIARSLLLCPGLALAALSARAELPMLAPVEVSSSLPSLTAPDPGRAYSTSTASADGVAAFGGGALTNPYKALDLMPSVNLSGQDAYGLTVDQNFMRIRGISAYTYSNLAMTVNGVPSTVNVGNGGMGNLYDLENVESISLTRGPAAADQGFGFGDLAGAMDLRLRAPAETRGAMVRGAVGSEDFHKLFARVDSGRLSTDTRLFFSASDAATDKWRGSGSQDRQNATVGLAQNLGANGLLELYAVHNDFARNEYRPLSYAQSRNRDNYDIDYNAKLTGVAAKDSQYYDYNRQEFTEDNVFAKLTWRLADDTLLRLSPYWQKTDGYRSTAGSNGTINRMDIEQHQRGLLAELDTRFAGANLTVGWWTQRIETIPPPLSQKAYSINASGALVFKQWGILGDMGERDYDSPFVKISGEVGGFKYGLGVRRLSVGIPGMTTYVGTGIGDISRDDALARNPAINRALTTNDSSFSATLPSASLQWTVQPGLDARLAYGRGVGNPWMGPLYSTYMSNAARFQAAGVTLQSLWDDLRLEVADTVEAGLAWRGERWTLAPTLYYSKMKDKQVTAFDPAVGVAYLQPGVHAHAYGAELEATWSASNQLDLSGSLSWNVNQLDDDIPSGSSTRLASKGNQVPDAPRFLLKLGAEYRQGDWRVAPMLRYVGKRYGDALNNEPVTSYTVADLHVGYGLGKLAGA
jgi:iron complex outermembrane receptor protein